MEEQRSKGMSNIKGYHINPKPDTKPWKKNPYPTPEVI
jgi:hypothetical protein